jgi:orotidine-5'-phosphate decarboxylase
VTHTASRRLIVALDFETLDEAFTFAEKLVGLAGLFKIGKQLFTAAGPEAVRRIASLGTGIFLDLKYHDIPNTVNGALKAAAALPGIKLVNIHTLGGSEMMRQAAQTIASVPNPPKLLGVTILTSTDQKTMREVGISGSPAGRVLALGKLAKKAGLDGLVASAQEVKALRRACGKDFILAIGGIRPDLKVARGRNASKRKQDDQSRIATPGATIRAGADYLVVGRPINAAPDPVAAARAILDEVAEAEAEMKSVDKNKNYLQFNYPNPGI